KAQDMYRRIFVIDSTDDVKSSVIQELSHLDFHEQRLTKHTRNDFIEFDPCIRGDCAYFFTNATILNQVDLHTNGKSQQSLIKDQLENYLTDGIHLILFIANNDNLNTTAYTNFSFMVSTFCDGKVPAICVTNGYENKMKSKYLRNYSEFVLDVNYGRERSKAIKDLWKAIESNSLKPSTEPNCANQLNKKHNINTEEKSTLKIANGSCARPIDSMCQNKEKDKPCDNFANEWKYTVVPGLFNEANTDLANLMRRCEEYKSCDYLYNCVLLTTGSLNPVHRSHIKNLELVKKHLERNSPRWNVLVGYLSPTHDLYVRGKLGKATIPGCDRCDLCELAIREHERETTASHWLSVSRAESEYHHGFVDCGPTTEALRQYINSALVGSDRLFRNPIYVVYVCGLDHFNKCPDVRRLAREKYIKCAVIYRKQCDERHISTFDESSNIIYVPLEGERKDLIDISSTEIRRCWENSSYDITQFTYASVADRLKSMNFHFR
ncbi:unnamed protein product, partial [Rotaria socialis]